MSDAPDEQVAHTAETPPGWRREGVAGITTFLTLAYIVVVNPTILAAEGTGIPFDGAVTATVLLAAGATLLMGIHARLPYAVAPGMGLNAFLAYGLVLGRDIPWPVALGMVFWSGVVFLVLSLTPLREAIVRAIPPSLRAAAAAGIGLFLAFLGLRNGGVVVAHPSTLVAFGGLSFPVLMTVAGVATALFGLQRRSPWAFLGSVALTTALAAGTGRIDLPETWLRAPDFSLLGALDPVGALELALLPAIVALFFTDLFDSLSTFVGVSKATGMVDGRGEPLRLREGLRVDALATLGAGLLGTSSGTTFIESAAGIEAGGRSGRTAIVTAACLLPCLFVAPLAAAVPAYATAPVLIVVGGLLFRSVAELSGATPEELFPAFLTVILIPLTFSITQGVLWGLVAHAALFALAGRRRELSPVTMALAVLCALLLALDAIAR